MTGRQTVKAESLIHVCRNGGTIGSVHAEQTTVALKEGDISGDVAPDVDAAEPRAVGEGTELRDDQHDHKSGRGRSRQPPVPVPALATLALAGLSGVLGFLGVRGRRRS